MRLGTPYTEVVERVVKIIEALRDRHGKSGKRQLGVDATGVGMPVVDMLRAAQPDCELTPVLITSGADKHLTNGGGHVPRGDLLGGERAGRAHSGDIRR